MQPEDIILDGEDWRGTAHIRMASNMFHTLFATLGQKTFPSEVLRALNGMCGASDIYVFDYEGAKPNVLIGMSLDGSNSANQQAESYMTRRLWLLDHHIEAGSKAFGLLPMLSVYDEREAMTAELQDFFREQNLRYRLLLYSLQIKGPIGIAMMRQGKAISFDSAEMENLSTAAQIIMPMVAKHFEICQTNESLTASLASLSAIEARLETMPDPLPLRLRQAAARFLYGMNVSSAATDLGVTEETAMTYRKRLYQRLSIVSQRDLLLWYLQGGQTG